MRDDAPDPLLRAVLSGLSQPHKTLPPTLFYDERGSALFDRITTLDDYYVTRAEAEVLSLHGAEIAAAAAAGASEVVMVEPGCGSGAKAATLLQHLPAVAYVGIDVSTEALQAGAEKLASAFPGVEIIAVDGDFLQPITLPALPSGHRVGFFPGSTIGNFSPDAAAAFLGRLGAMVGPAGGLVVGVDLWKDADLLRAAYDDREGLTAEFDKNALLHLNARYGADLDPDRFDHVARVNPELRRVEMHLRARSAHSFQVAGRRFGLEAGETLHTENAYKYEIDDFVALAASARLAPNGVWTDPAQRFGVFVFSAEA